MSPDGEPIPGNKDIKPTQRKCANCGQVGHIKTNKKCVHCHLRIDKVQAVGNSSIWSTSETFV